MIRRRLDTRRHGSDGYTTRFRLAAIGMGLGFFVLGVQLAMQSWYDGRMLPGVVAAGHYLGDMTVADARQVLKTEAEQYRLKLTVANERFVLTPEQLGVTYDVEATLGSAYRSGRDGLFVPLHHKPIPMDYRLDRSQLNAFAAGVETKVGTPPVDAGLVVKGTDITPVPDRSGWSIDRLGLQRLIEADIKFPGGSSVALTPKERRADIQTKALAPVISEAKAFMATPIILTYLGKSYTPTQTEIGQWLAFLKQPDGTVHKLVPQVDKARLKNYVQELANRLDVDPVNKKVNVENGVTKVTQEGVNGTAIDQDALTEAITKAVEAQAPLTYNLTDHPIAFKTVSTNLVTLDYGRYIEVNLSKQRLWVWQDHQVIFESAITSGATGSGFGTVTGLFSIYYKTRNTNLVGYQYGYNYNVPVKYWMPFHSGYGLHDASWRNGQFGGQDYYTNGSHGCVNMPDATAEFIYNWAPVGTPVWVHN